MVSPGSTSPPLKKSWPRRGKFDTHCSHAAFDELRGF